jgi:hypothetical protein
LGVNWELTVTPKGARIKLIHWVNTQALKKRDVPAERA